MKKVSLMLNGEMFYSKEGKNVFSVDEMKKMVLELNGGENKFYVDGEDEGVSVDVLFEMLEGKDVDVCGDGMGGDNWVEYKMELIEVVE